MLASRLIASLSAVRLDLGWFTGSEKVNKDEAFADASSISPKLISETIR